MPAVYVYNANTFSCLKGLCGQFLGNTVVSNQYPLQIGTFYVSPYSNNVFQINNLLRTTITGNETFVDERLGFGGCEKACLYIAGPPAYPSISPTPTRTVSRTPSVTPSITKTPSVTPSVTPSISVSNSPNFTPSVTTRETNTRLTLRRRTWP